MQRFVYFEINGPLPIPDGMTADELVDKVRGLLGTVGVLPDHVIGTHLKTRHDIKCYGHHRLDKELTR